MRFELYYSSKPSEFEIQAYIYRHLREMGYAARGEVRPRGHGACRVDIAVFQMPEKKPILVVEVKKQENPSSRVKDKAKEQVKMYQLCGVPVCLIWGLKSARHFLAHVKVNGLPAEDWI